jgi:16S rRNA (adenine1518-N6/adenine1519-N6)-dimethyltransferase
MTGQEIREALEKAAVTPSRQLGQNFLMDPNMARWIVSQVDAGPDDAVVEVGPGTGALSEHLVGKVRRLILVEYDARLAAYLRERFAGEPSVEVHHADGARFDIRTLFRHRPVKFLGNLPYSSGGAIMKNFLSRPNPFERAVIMLQKEVVDRLAAGPRTKDYGVLSLRVQSEWHVESLRTVPPEAFHPRPKIDSAVALLTPRAGSLPAFDARLLDELLRRGFAQRRKQMARQMPVTPPWADVAGRIGAALTTRAEELSLEQWVALARAYDPHPLADVPQSAEEWFDVVDDADQVTGRAMRGEVHARGLLHRAVHIFVFNKRGEILLQQRSLLKDAHPGVWGSSVSGHVDSGEDYDEAAVRELEEEMGITGYAPERLAKLPASEETGMEHVWLYRLGYDGTARFPYAEVSAAQWFPVAEVDAWLARRPQDFTPSFRKCREIAQEQIKP